MKDRRMVPLADLEEAQAKIGRLQKKCDYKDEVIDQRNAECSRQFKEIERLRDRNEVLESSAEINRRIMDSYGPRFDEYDAEIERLRIERDSLHKTVLSHNEEILRLQREVDIQKSMWAEAEGENKRLRHEIDVQCSSEYVERILKENERLRSALELYGHHLCTCSSLDKMDSGTLFHRSDWPCDCGFKEAHREALREGSDD